MNLIVVAQMIYEIFAPFSVAIAAFFIGLSLFVAFVLLIVKAFSTKVVQ